jgi:hypothetical protein
MRPEVAPPLAANMNAAFKKVRGAMGGPDDVDLRDLIVARIVELAQDGVYDIEELSSRTLSSLSRKGSLQPLLRPPFLARMSANTLMGSPFRVSTIRSSFSTSIRRLPRS